MLANVLVRPGEIELREIDTPSASAGEVVVRVRAALTCGTDLKTFLRGHPKFPLPMLFGHEFSGEIAQAGKGVKNFREGDAVMSVPSGPCGECYYCKRGQENICESAMANYALGAYAEYIKVPAQVVSQNMFAKPDSLSYKEAALLEPLACVLHGLSMITFHPEDTVVIIGAGAIGLLHMLALQVYGLHKIIVIGRKPYKLRLARELGAYIVIDATLGTTRAEVLEVTKGRGADVVIECTGQPSVWEASVNLVRRGGEVIFFGGCKQGTSVSFDTHRLHYDQITIRSPFHLTRSSVRQAYELLTERKLNGNPLITGTYPLDRLNEVFALLQQGNCIKYAVTPSGQ
ncbi:MAG: alcohol dehydrogenase catalytic domain-containing protein [Acidobacteriota bacterium]|nr:alcohol dehydrogenase catalytic domain-containing protein [Blastocatellia bacterium]MDW8411337.1 alcohol dehydrogenase catalytic domain-containing protein [Acidobacteriota bacterium]